MNDSKYKTVIDFSSEEYNLEDIKKGIVEGSVSLFDIIDLYPMFKESTRASLNLLIAKVLKENERYSDFNYHINTNHIITKKLNKYLKIDDMDSSIPNDNYKHHFFLQSFSEIVDEMESFSKNTRILFNMYLLHSVTSIDKLKKAINGLLEKYEEMDEVEFAFLFITLIPYKLRQYSLWSKIISEKRYGKNYNFYSLEMMWDQLIRINEDESTTWSCVYGLNQINLFLDFTEKSKEALKKYFKTDSKFMHVVTDKTDIEVDYARLLLSNCFPEGYKNDMVPFNYHINDEPKTFLDNLPNDKEYSKEPTNIESTPLTKKFIEGILYDKTGNNYTMSFNVDENSLYHIKKELDIKVEGDYFKADNGICYRNYFKTEDSNNVMLFKIIENDKTYGIEYIDDEHIKLYQFNLNKDKKYYLDEME